MNGIWSSEQSCLNAPWINKVIKFNYDWFTSPIFISSNSIKIACHIVTPNSWSGEYTAILCHGFPEIAFSWRFQVEALLKLGFRVVMPDLRGYGRSSAPIDPSQYSQSKLVNDIIEIIGYLKAVKILLIGHDFGGAICWRLAQDYPEKLLGLIVSSSPYPDYSIDPIEVCDLLFGKQNYFRYFQTDESVNLLNSDINRTLRFYFRRDVGQGTNLSTTRRKDRHTMSHPLRISEDLDVGELFLSAQELQFYQSMFEISGFEPPICWYRCIQDEHKELLLCKPRLISIDVPVLSIGAELDYVVPSSSCNFSPPNFTRFSYSSIPSAGHWSNQERPEDYNLIVSQWITDNLIQIRGSHYDNSENTLQDIRG